MESTAPRSSDLIPSCRSRLSLVRGHAREGASRSEGAGAAKPTPASEFWTALDAPDGVAKAVALFREARQKDPKAYLFPEAVLNLAGYERLQAGATKDAVAIFQLNVEAYPQSANAQDSLGDGYLADGQKDLALAAAKKCLEMLAADKRPKSSRRPCARARRRRSPNFSNARAEARAYVTRRRHGTARGDQEAVRGNASGRGTVVFESDPCPDPVEGCAGAVGTRDRAGHHPRHQTVLTAPNGIRLVLVKVLTSEPGLYGWGCATFTQRALVVQTAIEQYLKPFLVGRNVDEIEDIWQSSYVSLYWRNGPVLFNAMSGVDIALWDIKGKRAGMPLYQLLGGKCRLGAACYYHASGRDFQEVEDNARKGMALGYRHIRVQASVEGLATYGTRGTGAAAGPPRRRLDRRRQARSGNQRRTCAWCRSCSSICARRLARTSSCCMTSTSA